MFADFRRYPINLVALAPLSDLAFRFAERLDRSIYDCFYLALAAQADGTLVTADRKFYDVVMADRASPDLVWIEAAT